ncbi:hypothetical protein HWV62_10805 [Athelia sp. TMB]|nr:hypothetical protein HWV62_10805 [Athelia sp. TMB]
MPEVPFFPIDRVSVRLRLDGRFGDEDFTLAPQIFATEYAHRILVRRRPNDDAAEAVMWWTPSRGDFEPITLSSYQSLGRLHSQRLVTLDAMTWNLSNRAYGIIASNPNAEWGALEALVANMRHGIMRLIHSPYTYTELKMDVAQTQRCYLDALAMCDYVQDKWANKLQSVGPVSRTPLSEFMGAWTADPSVVQRLHHAGIPVYFVRHRSTIRFDPYMKVLQRAWRRDDRVVTVELGQPERYSGVPNRNLHSSTSQLNEYGGLSNFIFTLDDRNRVEPAGDRGRMNQPFNTAVGRRSRGKKRSSQEPVAQSQPIRDKWVEIVGDYMPPTVVPWAEALLAVDRTDRQATVAPKHYTGYRFPDPGMLIFSSARRERNIFNWLLVRDATIRRLMHDVVSPLGVPKGFSNELWRMLLGVEFTDRDKIGACSRAFSPENLPSSRSSSHSERRQAAITVFGQPPDGHNFSQVQWRGHLVDWDTFFKHDALLVQEIMWDIHQYSFQYDLISLDHYLCGDRWAGNRHARHAIIGSVFGKEDCFFVDAQSTRNTGIASEDDLERHKAYESLQQLMISWPEYQQVELAEPHSASGEKIIATRFCSAFVRAFGRPPILPKLIPSPGNLIKGLYGYKRNT